MLSVIQKKLWQYASFRCQSIAEGPLPLQITELVFSTKCWKIIGQFCLDVNMPPDISYLQQAHHGREYAYSLNVKR
jgi:hypothetical protein